MNIRHPERWFGPVVLSAFALVMILGLSARGSHGPVLHGAGATFPAPLYARWIALYEREHHIDIEYQAVGSGAGIAAITAREAHFGASDALMKDSELAALDGEILQIPMAIGPVVLAYNLPGLGERLTLDGAAIAGIYLGEISRWDDPALVALNPGLGLPDRPIRVAHRADSSGTTDIFTGYLSAVSARWAADYGQAKSLDWPVSSGAGEGNDGVAQQILLQPGGIGYMELKYAQNAGLAYAALINADGNVVLPSVASVQAAEENTPAEPGSILKPSIVNAPGADSYPIAGFTYVMVYTDLSYFEDPELAHTLVDYLEWSLTEGQDVAPALNYTPLPAHLRLAALEQVEAIHLPHVEGGGH